MSCGLGQVVGVGTTLKVTIQQSNESRAFNTGLEEQSGGTAGASQVETRDSDGDAASKFFCYICSITCHNQQVESLASWSGGVGVRPGSNT